LRITSKKHKNKKRKINQRVRSLELLASKEITVVKLFYDPFVHTSKKFKISRLAVKRTLFVWFNTGPRKTLKEASIYENAPLTTVVMLKMENGPYGGVLGL
jgi:hypothetical protein